MQHTALVVSRHVGSSWTGNRTRVSYIGRQILDQCATREFVLMVSVLKKKKTTNSEGVLGSSRIKGPKGGMSVSASPDGRGGVNQRREERRYKDLKKTGEQMWEARDQHWATF